MAAALPVNEDKMSRASASTVSRVEVIMRGFAKRTGLLMGGAHAMPEPRRYLWTDAFAVCNFLELRRQTGKEEYVYRVRLAGLSVEQAHLLVCESP